jgi:hypothetical protein
MINFFIHPADALVTIIAKIKMPIELDLFGIHNNV